MSFSFTYDSDFCDPDLSFSSVIKLIKLLGKESVLQSLSIIGFTMELDAPPDEFLIASLQSHYQISKLQVVRDKVVGSMVEILEETDGKMVEIVEEKERDFFLCKMRGILSMNAAGRRYQLNNETDKKKGMEVLVTALGNASCLYDHVKENVMLCSRGD